MANLTTAEQDLVVNLLETFVLDDDEHHDDPIYHEAERLVARLRSDEVVSVPMRRARLEEIIGLVRLEAERLLHEERNHDAAEAEYKFAELLQSVLTGPRFTGRDEAAAETDLRTILVHLNVVVPATDQRSASEIAANLVPVEGTGGPMGDVVIALAEEV